MINNQEVYENMTGDKDLSDDELKKISDLINTWASVTPPDIMTRHVFLACMGIIAEMGPAYCQLAAVNFAKKTDSIN